MLVANILVKSDFKENRKLGTTNCDLSTLLHGTSSPLAIIGQTFDDRFENHSKTFCRGAVGHRRVLLLITAVGCELGTHTSESHFLLTSLAITFGFMQATPANTILTFDCEYG